MNVVSSEVALTLDIFLILVAAAMALAGYRLLRGPTQADRVMALDVLVIAAVGAAALTAWRYDEVAILDLAAAVAMVTFITAVALAWYLERRGRA
jgi:multicomponent Na+:H+ antiporter subunit F